METFISFLKHSSGLELLVMLAVILLAVMLIPVGIWIVVAAQRRRPIYFFLMIALLPLLIALPGTYLGLANVEKTAAMFPEAGAEIVTAARQEAWIPTYIGAVGTLIPALIGVIGLVLKKDR
jgi:beta-lactamase regulating signal transducer with metallopeptidase domain